MFSSRKTSAPVSGAFSLTKSVRLRSSASAYLNRTPASSGNRQKWTWSAWVKRGVLGSISYFFCASPDSFANTFLIISFGSGDNLRVQDYQSGFTCNVQTSSVYRDVSSWYHIVVAIDTTQSTASNRVRIYVNGSEITAFSTATYPTQNTNLTVDNNVLHTIGYTSSTNDFDGYMTDVYLIDGQQLTPSSFGATNATTGQWSPAKYSGSYGTNGFHLTFANTTSTTTLGYDTSGNGNNWTTNNISLTAGSTYDSMNDLPVAYSATAANYAVMNPNANVTSNNVITNGNLTVAQTGSTTDYLSSCTFGITSNTKWYFEMYWVSRGSGAGCGIGITSNPSTLTNFYSVYDASTYLYLSNGGKAVAGTYSSSYGASFDAGSTIGVAYDGTSGNLTFYYNNTSQGTLATGLTGTFFPCVTNLSSAGTNTLSFNFGQQPFTYTPPSGYNALNTYNLPTPTIAQGNKYMDATLYTGNSSTQSITNAGGFKPDLVWGKDRSTALNNRLFDAVRGVSKALYSNNTTAETTESGVTAFNSNGFTLGSDQGLNFASDSYVAWQWQAGAGSSSSNTNGSITSTVSVNTTAGFSIVTYTGTGSSATVGHGLSAVPQMMIIKCRDTAFNWRVYHVSIGNVNSILLNLSAASSSLSSWNSTTPTSTVFSLGTDVGVNQSGSTFVAYCFAQIAGFSAFGSYTGNGSATGPFIYTGFKPKYVLIKRTDSTSDWSILDATRNPYNSLGEIINADTAGTGSTYTALNFLSNGFNFVWSDSSMNASGGTYIYACFASNPFAYSNAF